MSIVSENTPFPPSLITMDRSEEFPDMGLAPDMELSPPDDDWLRGD